MDKLPSEIVIAIWSYLEVIDRSRLGMTSWKWQKFIKNPSLWTDLMPSSRIFSFNIDQVAPLRLKNGKNFWGFRSLPDVFPLSVCLLCSKMGVVNRTKTPIKC